MLASPFEDGTEQAVADLLYPYVFAYRWGAKAGADSNAREPRLEPVLDAMQERLIGLKLVRVDETKHAVAEGLEVITKTPVLEVYLRDAPGDERQVAALAPPWSTVPWHLLVLMEEAVIRGYAAFSQAEAARRRVPWLDLVRDEALRAKLHDLAAQFERERLPPRIAARYRNRRRGAGALARAQSIRRKERAFSGRQRPLSPKSMDAGLRRARGRP